MADGPPAGDKKAPTTRERLVAKVATLPTGPGVYLFKDSKGKVLYVGKARSLRQRLRSYLAEGGDGRYQLRFLMQKVADLETLVTEGEAEALMLEANLIQQYKPRYNIRLKDDKSYLSVKVTTKDEWPRLFPTRRIERDGSTYLGPYPSASGVHETLSTIRRVFPLRTCSDTVFRNRSRPCLEYQIKRCLAPCVYEVDKKAYALHLDGAVKLLEGKTDGLLRDIERRMAEAAAAEEYEDAARLRDRAAAIKTVVDKQKVVVHGGGDRDVFGLAREGGFVQAQVLLVRSGRLSAHLSYQFDDHDFPDEEVLDSLLGRFYEGDRYVPTEVLLPVDVEGRDTLATVLSLRLGRKVSVLVPLRGEKKRLVEMAVRNAVHALSERSDETLRREKMLKELRDRLGLSSIPKRVECFDISHVSGEDVVASMVAFDEGLPDRSGYRHYRLKEVQRNDDYAAMKEVLHRRLVRGVSEGGLPDLLLVDGGRGQLSMAVEVLRELGVEGVELASLAKDKVKSDAHSEEIEHSEERVFRPGRSNPIKLRRNSNALFLLQRLRDEAHRFAITYHRKLRSKRRLRSELDDIAGVGPSRRKALLRHFGSVKRVREADVEEIASLAGFGDQLAAVIKAALRAGPSRGDR